VRRGGHFVGAIPAAHVGVVVDVAVVVVDGVVVAAVAAVVQTAESDEDVAQDGQKVAPGMFDVELGSNLSENFG
jgi:N-acyl-D-aspartate/D-glutamate deacylase